MSCSLRESYLDDRLGREDEIRFEQHVESCDDCRSAVGRWQQVDSVLQDWAGDRVGRTWRSDESQRQAEIIVARHRERHGQRRRAVVSLGLAAAASFFLAVLLFGRSEPDQSNWEAEILYREGSSTEVSEDILSVLGSGRLVAQLGEDRVGLGDAATVRILGRDGRDLQLRLEQGSIGVQAAKRGVEETLVVHAGGYAVRVVGTRFRVSRPSIGGLVVAVDEGVVEVTTPGQRWWLERGASLEVDAAGEAVTRQRSDLDPQLSLLLSPAKQNVALVQPGFPGEDPEPAGVVVDDSSGGLDPAFEPTLPASPPPIPLEERRPADVVSPAPAVQPDFVALRGRLAQGRVAEVIQELEVLLAENPDTVEGWILLATARRKSGDLEGAVDAHRQVVARGSRPQSARARYEAARLLQRLPAGHAEAVTLFEGLITDEEALQGLQPEIRLHLGRSLQAMGRRTEAQAMFEDVLATYPGTAAADAARSELSTATH